MTNDKITAKVDQVLWKLRRTDIPRRKGVKLKHPSRRVTDNLKNNATRMEFYGKSTRIFIDETIAPYAPYTNEKWVSPHWKGADNPNEGWFDEFAIKFIQNLALKLHGEIRYKHGRYGTGGIDQALQEGKLDEWIGTR